MTQRLKSVGRMVLAAFGLCLTVWVGMFLAGLILGFASTYRSPTVTITRYLDCSATHRTPECEALAKQQSASSGK